MNRFKRLYTILQTINRKKKFTARELAEEFNVSVRTIQRDLLELADLGVSLYATVGNSGGYEVVTERVLPPVSFTVNEATAMFFAYKSLENYNQLPFDIESISALEKLYNCLPADAKENIDSMRDKVMFWSPPRERTLEHLKSVFEAVLSSNTIQIKYVSTNKTKARVIQPFGLYTQHGYWYATAYCFKNQELRQFRVDRISEVESSTQEPLDQIQKLKLEDWFEIPQSRLTEELLVELTGEGVRVCELEPYLAKYIEKKGDGTAFISCKIQRSDLNYYANFFLSAGKGAKVISPITLCELIIEKIKDIGTVYKV